MRHVSGNSNVYGLQVHKSSNNSDRGSTFRKWEDACTYEKVRSSQYSCPYGWPVAVCLFFPTVVTKRSMGHSKNNEATKNYCRQGIYSAVMAYSC